VLPIVGTDPIVTAGRLRGLVLQAQNIPSGQNWEELAAAYVDLARVIERFLRETFTEPAVDQLYSERFWRINARELARPYDQLREEVAVQADWLLETADTLERMAARLDDPKAEVAVPDTHVLLHYKPLSDIDWTGVIGSSPVRLVIPLRVIDELDEKKYARRGELFDRARSVIRQLTRYLDGPGELREDVHIALVSSMDLDPLAYRQPPPPADVEILDSCQALAAYNGPRAGARLVTGDLGMRLRAEDRGISVVGISEDLLLHGEAIPQQR
jgi:hypothetical protein